MLKIVLILILFLAPQFLVPKFLVAEFPKKPINFVVYTSPGGLIDRTVRKLSSIMKEQGLDAPVVVLNKKGAGGLVAAQYVANKPDDGYQVLAVTSSVISKMITAKKESMLEDYDFLVKLVDDYECIITRKDSNFLSLEDLSNSASLDKTIWVGPAAGGGDHLFAKRVWKNLKLSNARWIPYRSGSQAIAALMGGHADFYVGNPQDILGRDSLRILAIASPTRLSSMPHVETFYEHGYDELKSAVLWRGFLIRKTVDVEIKNTLRSLIKKAAESEKWRSYVKTGFMKETFIFGEEFKDSVYRQIKIEREL